MKFNERLSYFQSNEESHKYERASLINPCRNLVDDFNTLEEIQSEQLKVFLRIRPLLSEESITSQDGNVDIVNGSTVLVTAPAGSHAFKTKPKGSNKVCHNFKFTQVYDQTTSQKAIFEETTQQLVEDVVDGQNGLLFSYGATNSGKTFTIQGTSFNIGLLPRSLDHLFKLIGPRQYVGNDLRPRHFCSIVRLSEKQRQEDEEFRASLLHQGSTSLASMSQSTCSLDSLGSKLNIELRPSPDSTLDEGAEQIIRVAEPSGPKDLGSDSPSVYAVFVSFSEVYNEYIFDLLEKSTLGKAVKKSPLSMGEDFNGSTYIKGLKEVRVKTAEEALKILDVGRQNLHFAATKLNHSSSRSHCIFTIKVVQLPDPHHPHVAKISMLTLCDLAGAERTIKAALSTTDRLREASNINTSLLVLGRCIAALRQNQVLKRQGAAGCSKKFAVVPYRESKVTRLFQSFFMGEGKVAMIVNISLSSLLFDETLKVLKFSAIAREVTITQEKAHHSESIVGPSKPNQFSKFVRCSLNASNASSRLSVPWVSGAYPDVTFGEGDEKDHMGVVQEESEDEEEEEDDRIQPLLDVITKLKDKLLQECREKTELETSLRKKLCDVFSKRIVEIEESWQTRLDEECARKEELMEWRLRNVMSGVNDQPTRKRPREEVDNDPDQEMVPSVLLVREECKVRDLEKEKCQLEEELKAMKNSLKATSNALKAAGEENSKLLFKSAHNESLLKGMKEEKETVERQLQNVSSFDTTRIALDNLVVEELQHKNEGLVEASKKKDEEIKKLRDMLFEAADEFSLKDKQLSEMKDENSQQSLQLSDCESQLAELKDLVGRQRYYFEEREKELEELRAQKDKINSPELKSNEESKELTELKDLVSNLQRQISNMEKLLVEEKKTSKELRLDKMDLEIDIENAKAESKCKSTQLERLEEEKNQVQEELVSLKASAKSQRNNSGSTEYQYRIDELESELEELKLKNTQSSGKSENMTQLTEDNESLKEELERLKSEHDSLLSENAELLEKLIHVKNEPQLVQTVDELKKTLQCKNREYQSTLEQLRDLEDCNNDYIKQIETLDSKLETKEKQESLLLVETNHLKKEIDNLQSKLKVNNDHEAEFISNYEDQSEKLLSLQKDVELKNSEILSLGPKHREFESEISNLGEQLNFMKDIVKEKSNLVESMNKIISEKENQVSSKDKDLNEIKNEIVTLRSQISLAEKKAVLSEELCGKLKDKCVENENLSTKIKDLESRLMDADSKCRTEGDVKAKELELRITLEQNLKHVKSSLEEKENLVNSLSSKLGALDLKADEAESKCEMLEKEKAALREARLEDTTLLRKEISSRDQEISSLQQELKRTLQSSISEGTKGQTTSEGEQALVKLKEVEKQLKRSEEEKEKLLGVVSDLRKEIGELQSSNFALSESDFAKKTSRSKESLPSPSVDIVCSSTRIRFDSSCRNSEASDTSQKEISRPVRSTRSTRSRKTIIDDDTPIKEFVSAATISDGEGSRSRSARKKESKAKETPEFKIPSSSSRSKRGLKFKLDEESGSGGDDDYVPPSLSSTAKNTRNSRAKTKSTRKNSQNVFNPHLENRENIDTSNLSSVSKNSLPEPEKEEPLPRTRNRRRRPLYSHNQEDQLDRSPDLLTPSNQIDDSPHSVVMRRLRNKPK